MQFDNFHALIDLPGSSYGGRDFPARFSMSLAFASFWKVDVVLPSTEAERLECLRDLGRTMQGRGKPCSDQWPCFWAHTNHKLNGTVLYTKLWTWTCYYLMICQTWIWWCCLGIPDVSCWCFVYLFVYFVFCWCVRLGEFLNIHWCWKELYATCYTCFNRLYCVYSLGLF